jgi:hypothetical protein
MRPSRSCAASSTTSGVLTIGFYNGVVRILATLQIDVEDGYHKYLDEFPLPKD